MAHTLYIKMDFFYSEYVPAVCLFSGRTEKLSLAAYGVSIPRDEEPDAARMLLLQLMLPLIGIWFIRSNSERVSLPIPAAPGAYGRWQFLRNGWWLGVPAIVVAPWAALMALGPQAELPARALWMAVATGVPLLLTVAAFVAGRLTTPSIQVVGRKDLRLRFPASMQTTYDAYLDGFFEYSENEELARKRVKTKWNSKLKYTQEDGEEGAGAETDEEVGAAETDEGDLGGEPAAEAPIENPPRDEADSPH